MKKVIKELIPYIIIVIVVVLFRTFIATPVVVDGPSMDPTLKNGELLILEKVDKKYHRMDIVIVKTMIDGSKERLVKRIIGLPGEYIEYKHDKLYVNGKPVKDKFASDTERFSIKELYHKKKIPEGYYFVMGDNRGVSLDSRDKRVGFIKKEEIVGKAVFRIFPFNKIGGI